PEHGRHMGADRLALRTRRAFAGAAVELRAHGRVFDLGGVDVTDPWLRHRCFLRFLLRLENEADTLYSPSPASSFACFRIATARSPPLARCLPRVSPVNPLCPAARACSRPSPAERRSAVPPRTGEGFLTIVT